MKLAGYAFLLLGAVLCVLASSRPRPLDSLVFGLAVAVVLLGLVFLALAAAGE